MFDTQLRAENASMEKKALIIADERNRSQE